MSIAETVVSLDRLLGDIKAYEFLLDETAQERDELRRRVHQLEGELAGLHARLSWRAYR